MKIRFIIFLCISTASLCFAEATNDVAIVSFDKSMQHSIFFNKKSVKTVPGLATFERLFKKYSQKSILEVADYKIPKIIHFIWLGSPLPERCKPMVASWKKFHPGWQVRLWTDADVASFKMKNKKAFDQSHNWGEKSDIWRYEILDRFGGLYVDTDFECVKPFDRIHQSCELFAGIAYGKEAGLYNGLIGTIPGHPIIKRCIESIKPSTGPKNNDSNRIMDETGPGLFTRCFLALAQRFPGDVVPFPVTYFYSYPNYRRFDTSDQKKIKEKWLKKESYAVHYWAASWAHPKPQVHAPKPNNYKKNTLN